MTKCLSFYTFLIVAFARTGAAGPGKPAEVLLFHRAHDALTSVIVHDIFSPPVSSRIYLYAHIAAYETLLKGDARYQSLYGQIGTFPAIPDADGEVDYRLAAIHAFLLAGKQLVFSEAAMEDSLHNILRSYKKAISPDHWQSSLEYGKKVSDIILGWATHDQYAATRKLRRYNYRREEGKWIPTPPVYMAAIEPHWKMIRPMALDSAAQFKPALPIPFDKNKGTDFYESAAYVYETTRNITQEQREIANFWDCNPFAVNVHGHMHFATKKLSPGGHWLSIAGIASEKAEADIIRTAAAYTLTAIAVFDGFISCWDEKYRSHLIRPESYINAYIDESWQPLLQTPPFPEYTSGHSVISTAAAMVLTAFFGEGFSFDDTSELPYGYKRRSFRSFTEACNEAAMSRLYGGIHYLQAIEEGQAQGRKVGELVLKKIRLDRKAEKKS
jgi:hypothetical protein